MPSKKAGKGSGSTGKVSKPRKALTQQERVRKLLGPSTTRVGWVEKDAKIRHLEERQKKVYNVRHGRCLVDFASKEAAKTWPGYVILPNGDQGPSPESLKRPGALEEYKRRYGWHAE